MSGVSPRASEQSNISGKTHLRASTCHHVMIAVRTWARGVRGVPAQREHVSAVPRPARQHPVPHLGEDAGEAPLRLQVHGPGLPGRVNFHCTTFVEKWTTLITRNSNLGLTGKLQCKLRDQTVHSNFNWLVSYSFVSRKYA